MSNDAPTLGEIVSNTEPAHPIDVKPINGKHVRLEPFTKDHFSDLYEAIGTHAELWTWWPDEPPSTASKFDEYMTGLQEMSSDLAIYAVSLPSGPYMGKAAGLAFALSEDRLTNRVGELGLFFGPPLLKTKAGTEVIYILGNLLFELNHRRVQWKTNALNVLSRRAAERYGFVHEGTMRQHQINKGRNRDTAFYSIIDAEWPICKKAFEMWLDDGNFDEQQRQKRKLEDIRKSLMKL